MNAVCGIRHCKTTRFSIHIKRYGTSRFGRCSDIMKCKMTIVSPTLVPICVDLKYFGFYQPQMVIVLVKFMKKHIWNMAGCFLGQNSGVRYSLWSSLLVFIGCTHRDLCVWTLYRVRVCNSMDASKPFHIVIVFYVWEPYNMQGNIEYPFCWP